MRRALAVPQHSQPERPLFESLEGRVQLAATGFAARFNFSPLSAPNAPGYTRDYGTVYGPHSNGLIYGWNTDHRSDATYQRSKQYNNPRLDSDISMQPGDTWNIALPNGYYKIHVLMGKPGVIEGNYRLDAEGQIVVKGIPYNGFAFIEGFATVQVTDRHLTLSPEASAVDSRLASIEIQQVRKPTPTPLGNAITWSRAAVTAPIPRVESSIVRLGGSIYTLGGFINDYTETTQRFDVMNIKTQKFTRLADLPGAATHQAATTDGKYIYVAGGQYGPELSTDLTREVWRYDIKRNIWQKFGSLPAVHTAGEMVYLGGKLHYIGGDNYTRVQAQTTHWVLDLANPSAGWKNAAPLPVAADHAAAFAGSGLIYFLGGDNLHGTSYLTQTGLYAYDPARDKWTPLAPMPVGTSHIEAAALFDGRNIFVVAGQVEAQQLSSNVFTYNLAANRWTQNTSLPTPRKGGVAWLDGDEIYYLSGDDTTYGLTSWAYVGRIHP